jgi:hypothetical protein
VRFLRSVFFFLGLWWSDRKLSVAEMHDEIFRRWDKAPTPGARARFFALFCACPAPRRTTLAAKGFAHAPHTRR